MSEVDEMHGSATIVSVPENGQRTGRSRVGPTALMATILAGTVAVEEARMRWTTFRLKTEMYASQEQAFLRLAEQAEGEASWYQLVAQHPESNVVSDVHRGQALVHQDLPRLIADRKRQAGRFRAQAEEARRLKDHYRQRW